MFCTSFIGCSVLQESLKEPHIYRVTVRVLVWEDQGKGNYQLELIEFSA
jgi:hypothetical protein